MPFAEHIPRKALFVSGTGSGMHHISLLPPKESRHVIYITKAFQAHIALLTVDAATLSTFLTGMLLCALFHYHSAENPGMLYNQ